MMTRPKMRVGNPLGDVRQPSYENIEWCAAHNRCKHAIELLKKQLVYLEGGGGAPDSYQIFYVVQAMHECMLTAIALRRSRLIQEDRQT